MSTRIHEEASEWLINLRTGDLDGAAREAFDRWIRTSPEHVRAYLEMAAIWDVGPRLDQNRRYETDELIALACDPYANVVPLKPEGIDGFAAPTKVASDDSTASARGGKKYLLAFAASIAAIGLLVTIVWFAGGRDGEYVTGAGEQHTATLKDGSVLELNARSRVRFRITGAERRAELLEGQALFRVAHDAQRPFIVSSNDTEVRVVGTQFDVKRRDRRTVVTVIEGRVAVSPRGAPVVPDSSPLMLSAGEQITVGPGGVSAPNRVDVSAVTAWREGLLVFDEASISEVVDEFNRYNARRLVVEDIGITHISGVFSSTDHTSLIHYFRQRPDIVVTETDEQIHVTRKRKTGE